MQNQSALLAYCFGRFFLCNASSILKGFLFTATLQFLQKTQNWFVVRNVVFRSFRETVSCYPLRFRQFSSASSLQGRLVCANVVVWQRHCHSLLSVLFYWILITVLPAVQLKCKSTVAATAASEETQLVNLIHFLRHVCLFDGRLYFTSEPIFGRFLVCCCLNLFSIIIFGSPKRDSQRDGMKSMW